MSVTGVTVPNLYPSSSGGNQLQQIQQDFQQLGQDLQSGNLSQAQQDYATLTAALPSNQQQNSNNPIAQAFAQLGQALQSGDLASAQQAFSTIQQDIQQGQSTHGHHHHRGQGGQGSSSSSQGSTIGQALSALNSALQSNNITAAQQAFSSLTQAIESQFGTYQSSGASASNSTNGTSLNVNA